jgi:hypothetical protein
MLLLAFFTVPFSNAQGCMIDDGESIGAVCGALRMTPNDVEKAVEKRAAKNNVAKDKSKEHASPKTERETELDILKDIRDLLVQMKPHFRRSMSV